MDEHFQWSALAAAAIGALLGSRVLAVLEQMPGRDLSIDRVFLPGSGQTIVGGLLGGWAAVELWKLCSGIRARTGDVFALPLCIGIAVGRIGCFLAGLADDTYGKPAQLPWAVDFGDGVPRHPTQLYEVAFLLVLACFLWRARRRLYPPGTCFRIFLTGYLGWRLFIDFLKPQPLIDGMNCIQWSCLLGLLVLGWSAYRDGLQGTSRGAMQGKKHA